MFVLLSAATPSRLLDAFPPGVSGPPPAARRGDRAGALASFNRQLLWGIKQARVRTGRTDEDADAAAPRQIDLGRSGRARLRSAAQQARPARGRDGRPRDAREEASLRPGDRVAGGAGDGDARRDRRRLWRRSRSGVRPARLSGLARHVCSTSSTKLRTRIETLLIVGHNPGLEALALAAHRSMMAMTCGGRSK